MTIPRPGARRPHRVSIWIAGVATMIGVWFGVTAPSQSPVTPAPAAVAPAAAPVTIPPAVP